MGEIKQLLSANSAMDTEKLVHFLKKRLDAILEYESVLTRQKDQIESILSSLDTKGKELNIKERNFIMSHFKQIAVIVTGIKGLEPTAQYIQAHLKTAGHSVEIYRLDDNFQPDMPKPYILIVPESDLMANREITLNPDIVVINNISQFSKEIEESYLHLYQNSGNHLATIFNADDRLSVELANNKTIRLGRTFYFSKNSGLKEQIEKIGGVISNGEDITIFGFNLQKPPLPIKIDKFLSFDQEVSLLASLAAVMDIGLNRSQFE